MPLDMYQEANRDGWDENDLIAVVQGNVEFYEVTVDGYTKDILFEGKSLLGLELGVQFIGRRGGGPALFGIATGLFTENGEVAEAEA